LNSDHDSKWHYVWNPTNIILFGLIIGAAAILSTQCWKINLSHETLVPEVSSLSQRIQDLESENLALKIEVNRLVELHHHAGHDHSHSNEKVYEKRSIKQRKVWTGADETPIHIPKYPVKEQYCSDEYLDSDDLFSEYNEKKCKEQKARDSDSDSDDDHLGGTENGSQFEKRKKKNATKDDIASYKREKFSESKAKCMDNENTDSDSDEIIRKEKYAKIQEERQKIFDEAVQKLEKHRKEKKQEKDKKHREDIFKEQKMHVSNRKTSILNGMTK